VNWRRVKLMALGALVASVAAAPYALQSKSPEAHPPEPSWPWPEWQKGKRISAWLVNPRTGERWPLNDESQRQLPH